MADKENKKYYFNLIGWAITIILSIASSWGAMNSRLYEVEAKIRLIETSTKNLDKNEDAIQKIQESLIRIEGKLDLKQDKKWQE